MTSAIKIWRLAQGLTKVDACELFGVTWKTLHLWENGTDPKGLELLGRIESVTGQKIQQLFPDYFKT
jgi:transcriptional regulator with XRE-family HTH domain